MLCATVTGHLAYHQQIVKLSTGVSAALHQRSEGNRKHHLAVDLLQSVPEAQVSTASLL